MHNSFIIVFLSHYLISQTAFANAVGSDHQNFNPTTSGLDFVTVQSGQTLTPGIINFGLFFNYAANTLSFLEEANPQLKQTKSRLNDKLLSADLNVGLGLAKNWDFGFSAPVLLDQDINNEQAVALFDKTGSTEYRLNAKYNFHKTKRSYWATILTFNKNNIDNNPYLGEDSGLIFNWELATSWKKGHWWYGANVGHRWRDQGRSLASEFEIDPIPNQYIASLAASRHIESWDLKWIIELYGSAASDKKNKNLSNRKFSSLEALSGLKWDAHENLAVHGGFATEVIEGFGSPDYRLYVGLNYTLGPVWKKSQQKVVRQAPPVKASQQRSFILTNVKFKFDSDELEESSISQITEVIDIIRELKDFDKLSVEGHTDSMGNDDYNMQLSVRRANAIKKILSEAFPQKADKIEATGYGETQPLADNSNYQGRAANRRVVVTVYGEDLEIQLSK